MPSQPSPTIIRFGSFELDLGSSELRKKGLRLRIQEQPFQVLAILVSRPNDVVSREELRARLWPDGTFVDYERGLNAAVARLRQVLQDSAETPRFIETVARRGYRFVAPVNAIARPQETSPETNGNHLMPAASDSAGTAEAGRETNATPEKRRSGHAITLRRVLFTLIILVLVAAAYRLTGSDGTPRITGYVQLTSDTRGKAFLDNALPVIVTDGARVYFTENGDESARSALYQVSQAGGETSAIPVTLSSNLEIGDISSDRSRLSLQAFDSPDTEMPLWTVPITGGAPSRLHDLRGRDATWSRDGRMIAFAKGNDLYVSDANGRNSRRLLSADGPVRWPRWAPDGKTLRYTVGSPNSPMRIETVSADGSNRHQFLPDSKRWFCCGSWTADGKYYVFERHGAELWAIRNSRSIIGQPPQPVRLTTGPISFRSVTPSPDGKRLYALGVQKRGQLLRFDAGTGQFVPFLGGISAYGVAASRDGEWYAWVGYPDGLLWRSRKDGSDRLQLTSSPMRADLPQWSPDGTRIAFVANTEDQPSAVYVVPANGGLPARLLREERPQGSPSWSPDGNSLAFGRLPWREDTNAIAAIAVVNLKTRQSSILPGSEGFYSPQWSPDGRYMQALTAVHPRSRVALFDFATQRWRVVSETPAAGPNWSRDGKNLYFINPYVGRPQLCRLRISDTSIEKLTELDEQKLGWTIVGKWSGLAGDDSPLVLRDTGIQEIYALDWHAP